MALDAEKRSRLAALDAGLTPIFLLVPRDFLCPRTDGQPREVIGAFSDPESADTRNRELGYCHVVARLRITTTPGADVPKESEHR